MKRCYFEPYLINFEINIPNSKIKETILQREFEETNDKECRKSAYIINRGGLC